MPTEPPVHEHPGDSAPSRNEVRLEFQGHPSVRATDARGWEIVDTDEWTERPGAIGYLPRFDPSALRGIRGRVRIELAVGAIVERLEATLWPGWARGHPFAFRRDTRTTGRPFAVQCSKTAVDLDRTLIEALRAPGARGELVLIPVADAPTPPGSLTLVAMPIGHQGDLPPRAIEALMEADLILAEDTREAEHALRWRGIRTPVVSCHEHNERARIQDVTRRLASGQRLALVSDAGTPLVSDPGYPLVQAALASGAHVNATPGPSAVLQALVLSGLPIATFRFAGFAPRRSAELHDFLASLLRSRDTQVVFESSHRIHAFVDALTALDPDRPMALCKDLTKRTEEILRGPSRQVAEGLRRLEDPGGEYCVVVGARSAEAPVAEPDGAATTQDANPIEPFVEALLAAGCPTAPIVKAWRGVGGLARDDAYARVQAMATQVRNRVASAGSEPPPP